MSKFSLFMFLFIFGLIPIKAFSFELAQSQKDKISGLISNEHCFATYSDKKFEVVNSDKYNYVSAFKFFNSSRRVCRSEYFNDQKINNFVETIADRYKDGAQVILKKHKRFYTFSKGKIKELEIEEIDHIIKSERKVYLKKNSYKQMLRLSKCTYCQMSFSGNYISVAESTQFSMELGWKPYFKLSKNQGLVGQLSMSSYYLEDDNLEKKLSWAYKLQGFYRYYLGNMYVEAGAGLHYFSEYQDQSSMYSYGLGYIFKARQWFLVRELTLAGIYFHSSQISWKLDIIEYNLGFLINF